MDWLPCVDKLRLLALSSNTFLLTQPSSSVPLHLSNFLFVLFTNYNDTYFHFRRLFQES